MSGTEKIPRKIHWCWLSGEPVPQFLQECIASWHKYLPSYEIKCWTQENFDVHSVPWVEQAVKARKWAFAADYIRLWAIYTEGGIYLDSDVEVLRPLDAFLRYDFFTGTDFYSPLYRNRPLPVDAEGRPLDPEKPVPGYGLQAAVIGSKAGNSYVKECMSYYETRNFLGSDGTPDMSMTMPFVLAKYALKYGFVYRDRDQMLQTPQASLAIFRTTTFASLRFQLRNSTYAFHHCAGSWVEGEKSENRIIGRRQPFIDLKNRIKKLFQQLKQKK